MKLLFFKNYFLALFLLIFFPFFGADAIENRGAFVIRNYLIDIKIKESGDLLVEERIEVEFSEPRHGIYRNVPIKYKNDNGFAFNMHISNVDVVDEAGIAVKFEDYKEGGDLVLKIGSGDFEVNGKQTYLISYKVRQGIRHFDDHSELYWNPIGTEWPTQIGSAKVVVEIPKSYVFHEEDVECFEGTFGSSSRHCRGVVLGTGNVKFHSTGELNEYEGLTIALRFPVDYFTRLTWWQSLLWFLNDNWGLVLPIVVFVGMLVLWFRRGRELDLQKTVIVQYDVPDNLTPGETNYLLKENYSQNAITADIVNLAVKGYLKIKELDNEKKDLIKISQKTKQKISYIVAGIAIVGMLFFILPAIIASIKGVNAFALIFPIGMMFLIFVIVMANFRRVKNVFTVSEFELEMTINWQNDSLLTIHEKSLMLGIFGKKSEIGNNVALSKLKSFHEVTAKVKNEVKQQIMDREYFERDFLNYKSPYVIAGIVIPFGLFVLGSALQRPDLVLGGIASGIILIGFGVLMSKKSLKGAEAFRYVQGFRAYVDTAERYRVRFQEDNKIFEKVLPYAMVFGLADKWGKVFENIYKRDPDWYTSSSAHGFSAASFSNSLNHNFASATRSVSTPPSSSSSGFSGGSSGGGGGGGGGGSW